MTDVAAEIRALQMAAIEDVERQLESDTERIQMADGSTISREAAWAATQAIKAVFGRGLRYDGQRRQQGGTWYARGEDPETGAISLIPLGRFPEALA